MPPFDDMYGAFDWAPLDVSDSEMGDYQSVSWGIEQLQREHDGPFFLAVGIYRPHLPWYVPRAYFDLFPLETVELPRVREDDLADVPEAGPGDIVAVAKLKSVHTGHALTAEANA